MVIRFHRWLVRDDVRKVCHLRWLGKAMVCDQMWKNQILALAGRGAMTSEASGCADAPAIIAPLLSPPECDEVVRGTGS